MCKLLMMLKMVAPQNRGNCRWSLGLFRDLSGDGDDPTEYKDRDFMEVGARGCRRIDDQNSPQGGILRWRQNFRGGKTRRFQYHWKFNSIDDFSPMGVAARIPQTAKLLEARRQLADLYGKVEANDKLDGILGDILGDADKRQELEAQLSDLGKGDDNPGGS